MVTLNRCPEVLDICISRGDTRALVFNILNPDGTTPTDLVGFSYLLTVDSREEPDDASTQQFQLTGIVSGTSVSFLPTAPNVASIADWFCDLEETDSGGLIETIGKGTFTIQQDITK